MDAPYYLSKYDPDSLRFYLTATLPETRDTEACPACPERGRGQGLEGSPWEDFVERNNPVLSRSPEPCEGASEGHELVATWGNLANAQGDSGPPERTRVRPRGLGSARGDSGPPEGTRVRPRGLGFMLSFAYKRFDGRVPQPGDLDDEDQALLEKVKAGFETVGELPPGQALLRPRVTQENEIHPALPWADSSI